MKKRVFALVMILLAAGVLHAQTYMIDSTGKQVKVNRPVVHSKPPEEMDLPKPKVVHDNNVLKGGLLYFVSGCIPVYYERRVLPWLSIEAGVGLTTRDFIADGANIVINGNNDNEGLNPYYRYNARKPLVGEYASIQPKFYIRNNAMEGFWLGPVIEFKRFNYKANLAAVNTLPDDNGNPVYMPNVYQKEYRNALDFTFNVGWQFKYNTLCLEYLMGAGFRRFWEQRSDVENAGGLTPGPPYFTNGLRTYNGYRPEFNMELNFGGFF